MDEATLLAALRLIRAENVGPLTWHRLVRRFGSPAKALAELPSLAAAGGRRKSLHIPSKVEVEKEVDAWHSIGAQLLLHAHQGYPEWLAETEDAPPVIGVAGRADLLQGRMVGIVGARNASVNGLNFARRLARELGEAGLVVCSGLARGIDAAAHDGALAHGTVGVLGCGLDIVYPRQNEALFERMRNEGAIVSEFPPGTAAQAANFPRRNRLISGMSRAVAVVEANRRSGSLITARLALEQGREVFAVPGFPLDPRAAGPNWLLRQGAHLLESAADIVEEGLDFGRCSPSFGEMTAEEFTGPDDPPEVGEDQRSRLLSMLSSTPVTVDELLTECHLSHQETAVALLELELAGRVERLPGNRVAVLIHSD